MPTAFRFYLSSAPASIQKKFEKSKSMAASAETGTRLISRLISVDYQVFGRVQGVFFRKYTRAKGIELGLVGWVANTSSGAVVGQLEGNEAAVAKMKEWLQKTGSPHSLIERCNFSNEKPIEKCEYQNFIVRRDV